ncbi:hypothetical protein GCM10023257_38670 [Streptomyces hyderabadensis]|uniref:Uncharacterized protein n=1 Tax=Streptomyces hyderabadensis TaxID=598549 RepID=A0ABP9IBF3_9ACTN
MKSPAREGESEAGGIAAGAGGAVVAVVTDAEASGSTVPGAPAASGWSSTVAAGRAGPPVSSATSSVLVSMSTDHTAGH